MALAHLDNIADTLIRSTVLKEAIILGKQSSILHALTQGDVSFANAVIERTSDINRVNIPFAIDTAPNYILTNDDDVVDQEKEIRLDGDVVDIVFNKILCKVPKFQLAESYTDIDLQKTVGKILSINIQERMDRDLVECLTVGAFTGGTSQNQMIYNNKPSYHRVTRFRDADLAIDGYEALNGVPAIVEATVRPFDYSCIQDMVAMAEGWYYPTSELRIPSPDLYMGSNTKSKGYILLLHPQSWKALQNDQAFQRLFIAKANYEKDAPQIINGNDYKGMVGGVHIFVANQLTWVQQTKVDGRTLVSWNLLLGSEAMTFCKKGMPSIDSIDPYSIKYYETLRLKASFWYGMKSHQIPSIIGRNHRFDYGVVHNFSLV